MGRESAPRRVASIRDCCAAHTKYRTGFPLYIMAEGGWDVQMEESDFMGINTVAPEEQPRLHTERLVSSRSRDSERKLSFPERGFRQQQQQPPAGMQLVRAAAVAADPFGEQEEDVEQEEWRLEIAEEELVQARNPHPVAPVVGFADRQHLDGVVRCQNCFVFFYYFYRNRTRDHLIWTTIFKCSRTVGRNFPRVISRP